MGTPSLLCPLCFRESLGYHGAVSILLRVFGCTSWSIFHRLELALQPTSCYRGCAIYVPVWSVSRLRKYSAAPRGKADDRHSPCLPEDLGQELLLVGTPQGGGPAHSPQLMCEQLLTLLGEMQSEAPVSSAATDPAEG